MQFRSDKIFSSVQFNQNWIKINYKLKVGFLKYVWITFLGTHFELGSRYSENYELQFN